MLKRFRVLTIGLVILSVLIFVFYDSLLSEEFPTEPHLSSSLQKASISVKGIDRSYHFYAPHDISKASNRPLVIVLHGSMDTGERVRKQTAYEFDSLSDRHQFIVVYPDGYENHWNDCRKTTTYSANTQNIDDVEFIRTLIDRFWKDFAIDESQVFVVGFSNGGHMAYRLALELSEEISAIATVSANLPVESNMTCKDLGGTLPVMIMNGTDDPINPFDGGDVALFGFGSRGAVVSALETVNFWRQRAGHHTPPKRRNYPNVNKEDGSWVEGITWEASSLPEVSLYKVHGGGHTIPQMKFEFPRLLGNTNADISGPEEMWRFFERQSGKNSLFNNGDIEDNKASIRN